MPRIKRTRKARFTSALALTGMTQGDWARRVGEVSRVFLNRVLNEREESARLTAKIDAFIESVEAQAVAA